MRVLVDGWPLLRAPLSCAAVHTWLAIEALRREADVVVAWPAAPPAVWEGVAGVVRHYGEGAGARLRWEQRALPRLAHTTAAHRLYGAAGMPLWPRVSAAYAPLPLAAGEASFAARLRVAMAAGGRANACEVPQEAAPLPPPVAVSMPPTPALPAPLPEAFVLYHHTGAAEGLAAALRVWARWGAGSIGYDTPLLLLGVPALPADVPPAVAETVVPYPAVPPPLLAAIYRQAAALLHPVAASVWGSPLALALAWGVPVVAWEEPTTEALVGQAAYLAPEGDWRALGAALVTTVVETPVAEALREQGLARARGWHADAFCGCVLGEGEACV